MNSQPQVSTNPYKRLPDGSSLVVDIYTPGHLAGGEKRPGAVFFHGGGWAGGTRDQFAPQAKRLCERGIICLTVEYRTRNSHGTPPHAALADAKSAMRWIRQHANSLGIDLKRFAACGGSAGGHLAAASLMCPGFDDPQDDTSVPISPTALILFNPVTDNGPEGGYGYNRIKEDFPAFSPAHNIRSGLPPTLFMLGTEDNLIPVDTGKAFKQKMETAGNTCILKLYEGADHGFFNSGRHDNRWYDETLADVIHFLENLGWIHPK